MAQLYRLCTLFLLFLTCSNARGRRATSPTKVPKNAILLSKISSLTLRDGKLTSSRRIDPIPQLTCVGPEDVCDLYKVDVMRCRNEGADYEEEDIQWACKASLPEDFKLGSTDVICEGYESSEDPYVLKGSCGVEYRLILTDKGEARYQAYLAARDSTSPRFTSDRPVAQASSRTASILFALVFLGVLFVILRGLWNSAVNGNPRRPGHRPIGGGSNDDDPPPPYDGPPAYTNHPKKQTASRSRTSTSFASSSRSSAARTQTGQGPWRPGFWSGALAGAGAGYAASQLQSRQNSRQTQMSERGSSSSSTAPDPSTQRHESTGFGGTRRR